MSGRRRRRSPDPPVRGRDRDHSDYRNQSDYSDRTTYMDRGYRDHRSHRAHRDRRGYSDYSDYREGESSRSSRMPSRTSYNESGTRPIPTSPPRAPRALRERSPSPTPPLPQSPSPDYIAVAQNPPSHIDDPTSLRKLLVLDLNGTLLLRSANHARGKYPERQRDAHGNFLPRLRPVHPRPYMSAFRAYLFAPRTRSWLDVMVWSSAQPHSVADMVSKCFGEDQDKMVAIWARDTLGLSSEHYFQKVQTTKDLAKPWAALAPPSTDPSSSPNGSIASTPRSSSPPSPSPRLASKPLKETLQAHSALTTLLLDDSPRKAELQPYNHVCICEYTSEMRSKDVESLQREQDWTAALEARKELDTIMAGSEATAVDAAETSTAAESPEASHAVAGDDASPSEETQPPEASRKRKRQKKLEKRAALLEQLGEDKPQASYDETLLAVIGVLDEIKSQANVAAWIRSGGLWGPLPPPASRSPKSKTAVRNDDAPPERASHDEDPGARSDNSDLSVEKGPSAISNDRGGRKAEKREKKRRRIREPSSWRGEDIAAVGNDEDTTVPSSSEPIREVAAESKEEANEAEKMWFEEPDVLNYWVARGRKALGEIGIPPEHGIER